MPLIAFLFSLLFLVKASTYVLLAKELFYINADQHHIPAEILLGNLPLVKGTIPAFLSENLLTVQPSVEAFLMSFFHISFYPIFVVSSFVELFIGLLGAFWIGKAVTRSNWGGLYCATALIWGWVHLSTMGYLLDFSIGMFAGILGISLGLFILGLWFKDAWISALILLGVLFDIHITNAVIVTCVFAAHILALVALGRFSRTLFKKLCLGAVLCFLISIPVLLLIAKLHPLAFPPELSAGWWKWIEVRKRYHVFPWTDSYQVTQIGILVAMLGAGFAAFKNSSLLSQDAYVKAFALFLTISMMCFSHWLGVGVLRNPTAAALFLTRSSVYLVPVACAFLYVLGQGLMKREQFGYAVLGAIILTVNFMPFSRPRHWGLCAAVILIGYALLNRRSKSDESTESQKSLVRLKKYAPLVVVFFIAVSGITDYKQIYKMALNAESSDWRALEDLKKWAVKNTAPEDVFIFPISISCGSSCLGRTTLIQGTDIGISIYIKQAYPFEKKVLKSMFGVDVEDKEKNKELKLDLTGYFFRKYEELTGADAVRIAKDFPGTKYLITFRAGATPETKEHRVDLPLIYQNNRFYVYSIKL